MKINKFIDHTLLAQDADEKKIDKLIAEAKGEKMLQEKVAKAREIIESFK